MASPPQHEDSDPQISFAIAVTDCSPSLLEAAAVHGHSIDLVQKASKYSYRRYALVLDNENNNNTTTATTNSSFCFHALQVLGYEVKRYSRPPVTLNEIESKKFKNDVQKQGCCGINEFIKLYALELPGKVAIQLDTDVVLLKPMDDVLDAMMMTNNNVLSSSFWDNETNRSELGATYQNGTFHQMMKDPVTRKPVNFFYTRDYCAGSKITTDPAKFAVQGGVLIFRPNRTVFEDMISVIKKGQYTTGKGWGQELYGGYWGASQIQGFMSYYYRRDETAVELNHCIYDNMVDDPIRSNNECSTMQDTCEDCRETPFEDIVMAHLTLCTKPWSCRKIVRFLPALCTKLHRKWFEIRESLDWHLEKRLPPAPADNRTKYNFWRDSGFSYCLGRNHARRAPFHPFFPQHHGFQD